MESAIRVFILHRHNLFRDLVLQALNADTHVEVIGATESQTEADRWVLSASPAAAIVELDPDFATRDDLRELFKSWSARRNRFAVVGADLAQTGVDVYVHRQDSAVQAGIAETLRTALEN